MMYRCIPRTDIEVSALALGTQQFGRWVSPDDAVVLLDSFLEAGGSLLDTADIYPRNTPTDHGTSETIIGRWLTDRGVRDQVVIATKVGKLLQRRARADQRGLSAKNVALSCDQSLRRLRTDYIDIYQCHLDELDTPLEETLMALARLVQEGKVRYIGCSNYSPPRLATALSISRELTIPSFVTSQTLYNVLRRSDVEALRPLLTSSETGLLAYNVLAAGFLSGKYPRDAAWPESPRASQVKRRYCTLSDYQTLADLTREAKASDRSVAQVALTWVLADSVLCSAIVGVRSLAQLREALSCFDSSLAAAEDRCTQAGGIRLKST